MPEWVDQYLWSVVTSTTLSALLTGGLIWLTKQWISERLKGAIEHEYSQKLETFKAELSARHEVALERLRADNATLASVQATANSAFNSAQLAAHEHRLRAIDITWKAVGTIRKEMPVAAPLFELMPDPLKGFKATEAGRSALQALTLDYLVNWFKPAMHEVQDVRPFIGEAVYTHFHSFYFLPSRICTFIRLGVDEGKLPHWRGLSDIQDLAKRTLTEDELQEFNKTTVPFWFLLGRIEAKMLTEAAKIISGQAAGDDALESARRVAEAIAEGERNANEALARAGETSRK